MTKAKGGRPPHQPTEATRKQVKALAAYGVPQDEIGRVIGISQADAGGHYREELDRGEVKANAKVAESLYRKATGDGAAGGHRRDLLAEDQSPLEGAAPPRPT